MTTPTEALPPPPTRPTRSAPSGAFPPPTRHAPFGTPVKEQRVRVALVGAGQRARSHLAPAIFQNSDFHLRAVWSRTQASASRFNLEVAGRSLETFYGDDGFQRLLDCSNIECFVVALPTPVQASFVDCLLRRHRHVFSEAPVALDARDAQSLLKLFESGGEPNFVWFISSPLRYEPVFHPNCMRLDGIGPIFAGELSAVLFMDPLRGCDGPPYTADSVFFEAGLEHIALLRQILGDVTDVNFIQLSKALGQPGVDDRDDTSSLKGSALKDSLCGVLHFESGSACAVNWQTSVTKEDSRFRLSLFGAGGSITVEQAASVGIARYVIRRTVGANCNAGRQPPHSAISVSAGAERQLEAWRCAICACTSGNSEHLEPFGPAPIRDRSPGHAVVDLIVLSAMLQSCGTTLKITRAEQRVH